MALTSYFQNDETAYFLAEKIRWPIGLVCPHCESIKSSGKLRGVTTHPATWKCYECRKPYNVRLHTFFEGSHAPLHVWFQLIYLLIANEGKISTGCIEKKLIITYKMAKHMKELLLENNKFNVINSNLASAGGNIRHSNFVMKNLEEAECNAAGWYSNRNTQLRFEQFNAAIDGHRNKNLDTSFISCLVDLLDSDLGYRRISSTPLMSYNKNHIVNAP